jgi:hypothetical protein
MPENSTERRSEPRLPLVLAAEITELLSGTRLQGRTADISRKGCYVDMLNPIPAGSAIFIAHSQGNESFEVGARVVYCSAGLGIGVAFEDPLPATQSMVLDRWLSEAADPES